MSLLFDTLRESRSIVRKLSIAGNHNLDDECIRRLGEYIQDNEYLHDLLHVSNHLTDRGVEILSDFLIGNTTLISLTLGGKGITDASVVHLLEIAQKTCIMDIIIWETAISEEKRRKIIEILKIPIQQREITINSNSKSAAKIS